MGRRAAHTLGAAALIPLTLSGCHTVDRRALADFTTTLATHDSATAALEQWCAARHIASPATVTAAVQPAATGVWPGDARRLLELAEGTRLGYRHVRLSCGATVLSEAHNWYVPDRLTPAMNRALDTSRLPFGKVAAPLGYRRERIGNLPRGARDCPNGTVLGHRALLRLPDGRPLALLIECYTAANLRR